MSDAFLSLAIPLAIVGLVLADDVGSLLIPLIVIVGVLCTLGNAAKGFAGADRRRKRHR